jgi:hypothetical protein
MDKMRNLAEQHIRESMSHLRHIDELMGRARSIPPTHPMATKTEALLRQIAIDRDRLAQELDDIRRLPERDAPDMVNRGAGLKGLLESVGLQLEEVLAAIFKQDK